MSRRAFLPLSLSAALVVPGTMRAVLAADPETAAVAVVQRFYDALLAVMKDAKRLSFDQRYQRLAPVISQTYNLALMSRLAVGPTWPQFSAPQQQRLTDAFARYTIAIYANRFDDFNGERFQVDPATTSGASGVTVRTSLLKSDGEKVALNYLLRQGDAGAWQIIDIYLSGTISELATRRSEFAGVLQQGGADALVKLLEQRTAALHTG